VVVRGSLVQVTIVRRPPARAARPPAVGGYDCLAILAPLTVYLYVRQVWLTNF
jgi:hypothetical protein